MRSPMDSVRLDCGVNRYNRHFKSVILFPWLKFSFLFCPDWQCLMMTGAYSLSHWTIGTSNFMTSREAGWLTLQRIAELWVSVSPSLLFSYAIYALILHYDRVTIVWCTVLLGHLTITWLLRNATCSRLALTTESLVGKSLYRNFWISWIWLCGCIILLNCSII